MSVLRSARVGVGRIRMFGRIAACVLVVPLLLLTFDGNVFAAGQVGAVHPPKSPLSGSVLVARALRAGHVTLGGAAAPGASALPNLRASEGGQPVNEDPITSDPNNPMHLLSGGNDFNCNSLEGFFSSGDGGASWSAHCLPVVGAGGCGDPAVAYDLNGVAYIMAIGDCDGFTGSLVLSRSHNHGATWSRPAIVIRPLFNGGITDKEFMEIDQTPGSPYANNIYVSNTMFDPSSNSEIAVSTSTDGGAHFHTVGVDGKQPFPVVDQFSDLAIGADGAVYVTWIRCKATGPSGDCGGTVTNVFVSRSTDGGASWSAPTLIANVNLAPDNCGAFYGCLPNTSERVSDIPVIASDNSSGAHAGNLYTVFYSFTGGSLRLQSSTSTDGGGIWSAPVSVDGSVSTDQFFPWVNVSRHGRVGVTWLDRRLDPNDVRYDAFATTSPDGATFAAATRVSTVSSNPFNDGFGGGFMGDYTGNTWAGNRLMMSWMDTRNHASSQDYTGGIKR